MDPITVKSDYLERERPTLSGLYGAVLDYDSRMAYIAHWLIPVDETFVATPIGPEAEPAGLESNPGKHPDQVFWKQKKLAKMPSESSVIVTDCKLLPCDKTIYSCQYVVPALVAKIYGKGIPMAIFAHNDRGNGVGWCYYTYSGASPKQIDKHIEDTLGTWEWE